MALGPVLPLSQYFDHVETIGSPPGCKFLYQSEMIYLIWLMGCDKLSNPYEFVNALVNCSLLCMQGNHSVLVEFIFNTLLPD